MQRSLRLLVAFLVIIERRSALSFAVERVWRRRLPSRRVQSYSALSHRPGAFEVSAMTMGPSAREELLAASNSSVLLLPATATTSLWKQLAPDVWETSRGVDVEMEWSAGTPCREVARRLLLQAGADTRPTSGLMEAELTGFLESFVEFTQAERWIARLVSSRGKAATRCPKWHMDYVPVRWIQALAGPGCDYVDPESQVRWEKMKALKDTADLSVSEQNRLLVEKGESRQVPSGRASLLLGRKWKTWSGQRGLSKFSDRDGAVHKSPDNLKPWEGRVLLTMDIIESSECDCC